MIGVTCTVSFRKGTKKPMRLPTKRSGPNPIRENRDRRPRSYVIIGFVSRSSVNELKSIVG